MYLSVQRALSPIIRYKQSILNCIGCLFYQIVKSYVAANLELVCMINIFENVKVSKFNENDTLATYYARFGTGNSEIMLDSIEATLKAICAHKLNLIKKLVAKH